MKGSLIHGTHRTQDLIPAFMSAISRIANEKPEGFDHKHASALEVALLNAVPSHAQEDDAAEWWDSEDASYLLNEELLDSLCDCAPEGFYFGAHEGDGSDFGFWEDEEH